MYFLYYTYMYRTLYCLYFHEKTTTQDGGDDQYELGFWSCGRIHLLPATVIFWPSNIHTQCNTSQCVQCNMKTMQYNMQNDTNNYAIYYNTICNRQYSG